MISRIIPGLILGLTACLLYPDFKAARAGSDAQEPRTLTILGLDIGNCTAQDIYSRMGPTIPVRDDTNQLCYVSDRDDTLILFATRGSRCIGFKMMSQKKRFYKWHFCEKSPLVSRHLPTGNGIKLGMSKNQLTAILGPPESESDNWLNYVIDRDRKTTIRAEFSEAGLISFDLSIIRQY